MRLHLALMLQALWAAVCQAAVQHYPAAWGHYDVCKSQVYSDEGLMWDYMACQPEAADMTQYLKVALDPPNITCGDPPETYCALVSTGNTPTSIPGSVRGGCPAAERRVRLCRSCCCGTKRAAILLPSNVPLFSFGPSSFCVCLFFFDLEP